MPKLLKLTALATASVLVISSAAFAAEGGVPEALRRIDGTLNALIATLNQLSTKVDQLVAANGNAPTSSVLLTSSVTVFEGIMHCSLTNAGPTVANVKATLVKDGLPLSSAAFAVQPLQDHSLRVQVNFGPGLRRHYCKFEVDAPPSQLRASLAFHELEGKPIVVVEAR